MSTLISPAAGLLEGNCILVPAAQDCDSRAARLEIILLNNGREVVGVHTLISPRIAVDVFGTEIIQGRLLVAIEVEFLVSLTNDLTFFALRGFVLHPVCHDLGGMVEFKENRRLIRVDNAVAVICAEVSAVVGNIRYRFPLQLDRMRLKSHSNAV